MRTARSLTFLAATAACCVLTPQSADAYWWAGAYGQGIGGLYRSLDFPTELRVPYFASRPPVYYSQPVPRTYGYSPFAYPPTTRTPDVCNDCAEPVEIVNPYVTPSSSKGSDSTKRSKPKPKVRTVTAPKEAEPVGPLMIHNPFVVNTSKTI